MKSLLCMVWHSLSPMWQIIFICTKLPLTRTRPATKIYRAGIVCDVLRLRIFDFPHPESNSCSRSTPLHPQLTKQHTLHPVLLFYMWCSLLWWALKYNGWISENFKKSIKIRSIVHIRIFLRFAFKSTGDEIKSQNRSFGFRSAKPNQRNLRVLRDRKFWRDLNFLHCITPTSAEKKQHQRRPCQHTTMPWTPIMLNDEK